jgi:hypothetical protein
MELDAVTPRADVKVGSDHHRFASTPAKFDVRACPRPNDGFAPATERDFSEKDHKLASVATPESRRDQALVKRGKSPKVISIPEGTARGSQLRIP